MSEYMEFDYKNPVIKQRIRRKIKATQYQADLLKDLLDTVIEQNLDEEHMITFVRTNAFYESDAAYLEAAIRSLYYSYCEKEQPNIVDRNEAKEKLMASEFSVAGYDARFCLLGKAGVGKSTLIKKISPFWGSESISFPFTDTSRTSTFPADYCFVHKQKDYRFIAIFNPSSIIELNISECIERAVNKLIDLSLNSSNECTIDAVFNSFVNDPSQTYDIRYSIGRYIRSASTAHSKEENRELVEFWNTIFSQLERIVESIVHGPDEQQKETSYYQLVYSDAVKSRDTESPIYQAYQNIMEQVKARSVKLKEKILNELRLNSAIKDIKEEISDDVVPYFSCTIDRIDSEDFYNFIRIFTAKSASQFGHSFFNLVTHLRIELPLNSHIELPQKGFKFVLQDTIGIAHSNDGNGGFENSTNLQMSDVDAVVLIDDSRLNGDNNITDILQHLIARVAPQKLHFAFSFFDELNKQDFDEDDDLRPQRISYLVSTESNTIRNVIHEKSQAQFLIDRLGTQDTFFLEGLMIPEDFKSVNALLDALICNALRSMNGSHPWKPDPGKEFVSYDFKKIPSIYKIAVDEYYSRQQQIYESSPPHYKTTEALTYRLSYGGTVFSGAQVLRPVDDLFDCLVKALAPFIDNPADINFKSDDENTVSRIIGEVKTKVTESLRNELNRRFLSPTASTAWQKLYSLSGTGSDQIRRRGIISMEKSIASDLNSYLDSTVQNHIINRIESAFTEAISEISKKLQLDQ